MSINKRLFFRFIVLGLFLFTIISINVVYSANSVFIFNKNLTLGSNNNDVKELQKYLNNNGFTVAKTGSGSLNKETTYFGPATKKALIKFQQANKIKPAVGYFGPLTRNFINLMNHLGNKTGGANNNSNSNNNSNNNSAGYTIGGSITGLGGPVTIQNNNNQDIITINSGSSSEFIFPTKLNANTNYIVTIKQNYLGQACYIKDNTGVITNFNITNIKIACGINLYFNPFEFRPSSSSPVYTLSYAAGANGSITGATSQFVTLNNNASTVTATPNEGYYFVSWSDGILTSSRTDNNIIANKSVTASFAINTYTLTSSAGANGTITATDTVNYGSNKTFTITPDEGYLIEDVLVDDVSVGTDSTYTFTNVTSAHTISATFAISFACGTSTVSYGGQIYSTVSIGDQCWFGENLNIGTETISDSSEPECHDISGDGSGYWSCQVNNNAIEKYCYGNDSANCTTDGGLYEWAETLQLPYDCNNATSVANEDGSYTITCPDTEVHTISAQQQGICPSGWHIPSFTEYQTLAQVSDPGCTFYDETCVTAGNKLKATSEHLPIVWDGTDIYNFSALPSGTRGVDSSFYGRGENLYLWSLTFSSSLEAQYVRLDVGDSSIYSYSNVRNFGHSVRCIQDYNTYTITSSAGANGSITPTEIVQEGTDKTFTITPDEGYLIEDILVDNVSVGTDSTYTFTNVMADHTISATFAVAPFVSCGDNLSYGEQIYSTVSIGNQCWLGENLNIGTMIGSKLANNSTVQSQTNNSIIEKYCHGYIQQDNAGQIATGIANCATDGGLYQWSEALQLPSDCNNATSTDNGNGSYALACPASGSQTISANQQGICPTGWHIPSFNEYQTLAQVSDPGCTFDNEDCVTAGDKLKATSEHSPTTWDGTDIYNFSALPSGLRGVDGSFFGHGNEAYLWSSAPYSGVSLYARFVYLATGDPNAFIGSEGRINGYSVRCLKN